MRKEWAVMYYGDEHVLVRHGWNGTPLEAGLTILALHAAATEVFSIPSHIVTVGPGEPLDEFVLIIDEAIRAEAARLGLAIPSEVHETSRPHFKLGHIVVRAIPKYGELQLEINRVEGCSIHSACGVVKRAAELLGVTITRVF